MNGLGPWIITALVVIIPVYGIFLYNSLVQSKNQTQNGWQQIDVQLKRRYDLIPNLVEAAKDYMGFEQETLQKVINARNTAVASNDGKASPVLAEAEKNLTQNLRQFFALAESYPDLKSNQTVQQLMEEITTTENKISFARQFYNDSVMSFNNKMQMFPSNLIANWFHFGAVPYFILDEEEQKLAKTPVKVNLR